MNLLHHENGEGKHRRPGWSCPGESEVPENIYELFPVLLEMKNAAAAICPAGNSNSLRLRVRFATKPKVLLLDRATEGIQPSIIKEMARTLKRIRDERGLSIVVSEQVLSSRSTSPIACLSSRTARSCATMRARGVDAAQISEIFIRLNRSIACNQGRF